MKTVYPPKLEKGDEIRVVAPATNLRIMTRQRIRLAVAKLNSLGYKVTFGKHVSENDIFGSSSVASRIKDIHDAFKDRMVKAILPVMGGFNCNQLLAHLDYGLIKRNPKIFLGYSDITALQDAIYAKTGVVTYSGPAFSIFSTPEGYEDTMPYTLRYFKKCITEEGEHIIEASKKWTNSKWWRKEKVMYHKNKGNRVIQEGTATGTLVGGNLCTLNLLQGTEFMPPLKDCILFIEDDHESQAVNFERDLQSVLQLPDAKEIKGIVIGRFEIASNVTPKMLDTIIKTKKELKGIPVIADVDFGHTRPLITFPIGGKVSITAKGKKSVIQILKH